MKKVIPKSKTKLFTKLKKKEKKNVCKKFCFRFWNYFLHYIIQIIFIVFNIYSVDESDLQRDEVVIIEVFGKKIYMYICNIKKNLYVYM